MMTRKAYYLPCQRSECDSHSCGSNRTKESQVSAIELRQILENAQREGWTVEKTNGHHLKLTHPRAIRPVLTGSTPGGGRAIENFKAELKRVLMPALAPDPQIMELEAKLNDMATRCAAAESALTNMKRAYEGERMLRERAQADYDEALRMALDLEARQQVTVQPPGPEPAPEPVPLPEPPAPRLPVRAATPAEPTPAVWYSMPAALGDRIRERRVMLGLSQREAADRIGIYQTVWSQFERKVKPITPELLPKIARALHTQSRVLLAG